MNVIWAVARHMIAEGIRMKVALVLLVLLVLIVLGLPFSITGDSSLTGAVQSFTTYSLSATGLLLGILTIFLSRSVSHELVNRQIFLLMTKPVARWQYLLGKWLGVTMLNAWMLAFAGLATYGLIYYIKWSHPPLEKEFDPAELKNEVLVARHALKSKAPDFRAPAKAEMEKNREEGLYANVPDFNPQREIDRLSHKHEARWRIVPPRDQRVFEFENVLVDRARTKEVQLRYKTEVSQYAPDEVFRAAFTVGDPMKGTPIYTTGVRHVVGRYHTLSIPADAVADDHTLKVLFTNVNPYMDGRRPDGAQYNNLIEFRKADQPEVLFIVGSFEGNLFRLLIMMWCKLMFLSALSLMFTTIFSFPVACLASFSVYALAGMRAFILDALDFAGKEHTTLFASLEEFAVQAIGWIFKLLGYVIPDFARYDAIEGLVNGRNISLVWVLQAIGELTLFKTSLALGLAMLLFHRREVAEVSV